MIGLIAKESELQAATEFFELFKTPWEVYDENTSYDVVVTTGSGGSIPNAKLIIAYGSEANNFDINEGLIAGRHQRGILLEYGDWEIPLYGPVLQFSAAYGYPRGFTKNGRKIIATEIQKDDVTLIRVGYDLLGEVSFLLTQGQPLENAGIPSLDLHISLLRDWILGSGIPLVEILAVPAGHSFFVCLTHDVDFVRIGDHIFDHTMWGFVYRALFVSLVEGLKGITRWRKTLKNWKSVLLLPLIYLGLKEDFWLQFDRYLEFEGDARSTFFIIPFRDRAGGKVQSRISHRRAAKYDVKDITEYIGQLIDHGDEIAVHGIDAWHDEELGRQEYLKISTITGSSELGNRVHWLCFDQASPQTLEKSGFTYDSTSGYNDALGFRNGTFKPFRPLGSKKILELPLIVQDNALMRLNGKPVPRKDVITRCSRIFESAEKFGGVVTILWHLRSLGPERFWDEDYTNFLEECKNRHVWFGTGLEICRWFLKRRSIRFEGVNFEGGKVSLKVLGDEGNIEPLFILRIYCPKSERPHDAKKTPKVHFVDIPFSGNLESEIAP
jgi:hypothetical protein